MKEPERLLAVNLNYLGDALFTTPALAVLRARFPAARIDALAGGRAASILAGNPDIDRLLVRPPRGGWSRNTALLHTLRTEQYDAVVLFQSFFSTAALTGMAGVPIRAGFAQDGARPFLTHPVAPRREGEHVVDAYIRLAEAFGTTPERSHRMKLILSAEDTAFADTFWHDHEMVKPVVGMIIGATRAQKRWPEAYFSTLADRLWNSAGVASLLLGGPEEAEAAARIAAHAQAPVISAVGRTSVKEMSALVGRCDIVVSGDSGPLHIATALGTPYVALFGSTDPRETGPWSGGANGAAGTVLYDALHCAPCRKSPTCHERYDCMQLLQPGRVYEAIATALGKSTRRPLPMTTSGGASR